MIEASKTLVDGVPGGHVYTDRLMAIWEAIPEEQRSEFLTDSDLQEPNFMVRMTGEATAEVDVALWRQGDTPLNITLDLQKVGENWLIDEIRAPDMPQPFSELLQQVADASAGTGN